MVLFISYLLGMQVLMMIGQFKAEILSHTNTLPKNTLK